MSYWTSVAFNARSCAERSNFARGAGRHLRSACSAKEASCAVRVPDVPGRGGSPSLLGMRCSCAASSSSAADRQRLEAYSHQHSHF